MQKAKLQMLFKASENSIENFIRAALSASWFIIEIRIEFSNNFMSRKSILVVDDEKSQREILEMILSGENED